MKKRWRFWVTDFDDNATYVDADGGPDGDAPEAEFIGTGHEAISDGDRGCAEKYCCCGCRWHIEDFHHCTTVAERDECVCSQHKGWICMPPESERAHSGWSEHGMCEMWTAKQHNGLMSRPATKD